jgi:hypothetical protein
MSGCICECHRLPGVYPTPDAEALRAAGGDGGGRP